MPNDALPKRLCDLVMKGGVTSGVVYPLAVCELAKLYSFKNIGGTSAGAIAAAATAAAEYARRSSAPAPAGFEMLAALPAFLGQPGQLVSMFAPSPRLASLFAIVTAVLRARTAPRILLAITGQLLRTYWVFALVLGAAVLLADQVLLDALSGVRRAFALGATIVVAVVAFLGVISLILYRKITRDIPDNFYALSKGFDPSVDLGNARAPLTNWLTRYLNELAGKPLSQGPLTFGDLYRAPRLPIDPDAPTGPARTINLEMMTTALNHGRPYRLPFQHPNGIFFFTREEFEQVFPKVVVDHMVRHARVDGSATPVVEGGGPQLYGFPGAENVPVVVATRMSLSFPLLLSAVPLYAVDFTRAANRKSKADEEEGDPPEGLAKPRTAERCWFSDGGICSNLPIHFFDAPLPRWPTFGINLKEFHPEHQTEEEAVYLPSRANANAQVFWNRFEKPESRFSGFLFAILNTMQNWRDNCQSRIPGYRDRLAHISQRDDEGGLNLNMLPDTIGNLSKRGQRAGKKLVERFGETPGGEPAPGWPDHRWVRFRSSTALTIEWLRLLERGFGNPVASDQTLEAMLCRGPEVPPEIYQLRPHQAPRAQAAVSELMRVAGDLIKENGGLEDGPRPTPELRITPSI
jgi:predicted acylesterase/phospholipase RssA